MALSPLYEALPAERLVIRDVDGVEIPALLVRPEGAGPWPAVVVQHGYGPVDKTSVLPLAVYLALEQDLPSAIVLSLILLAVSVTVLAALRDRWISSP